MNQLRELKHHFDSLNVRGVYSTVYPKSKILFVKMKGKYIVVKNLAVGQVVEALLPCVSLVKKHGLVE